MEQHFSVYRHEDKFLLSPGEAACLREMISAVLQKDRGGPYTVRSLYFDTPGNRDLDEKLLGISERKKFRMRIYHTDAPSVKLEIKNKTENLSHKETAVITREDAQAVIDGRLDALSCYQSSTAQRFMEILRAEGRRPAALVEYQREAFLCPAQETRITFDRAIVAAKSDRLFDPCVPMVGLHSSGITVLEVKYNSFLPEYLRQLLSALTMQSHSVSKYATARIMLY